MGSKAMCTFCILFFLLFASPFVILITLSYVGVKPRFYIQELYIPSLNTSSSPTHNFSNPNTSIIIDLKFKREIAYVRIRYQNINITLFYGPNRTSLGSALIAGFSQGKKKTARRRVVVDAPGLRWEEAFARVSGGSGVEVAVEVATGYMLRRCNEDECYYTKAKAVAVAADLVVDGSGLEVSKKPTRLKKRIPVHFPACRNAHKDINLSLYYGPNRTSVGSAVVAGFKQGRKKVARRRAVVDARGLPWEEAFKRVSGVSTVEVAVEVSTGYRLLRCGEDDCSYTGAKAVVVAADLVVDGSGVEVSKKPTRLKKVRV